MTDLFSEISINRKLTIAGIFAVITTLVKFVTGCSSVHIDTLMVLYPVFSSEYNVGHIDWFLLDLQENTMSAILFGSQRELFTGTSGYRLCL